MRSSDTTLPARPAGAPPPIPPHAAAPSGPWAAASSLSAAALGLTCLGTLAWAVLASVGWAALVGLLLGAMALLVKALASTRRLLHLQQAQGAWQAAAASSRLEALFDALPDMVWLKDGQGVYLDCNEQFERLYGKRRAEMLGRTDRDFADASLAEAYLDNDRKAIEAGRPRANEEWVTCAGEQEPILLETVKSPLFDGQGQLIGVLGVARDITERKRTEESLRESETRLSVALNATRVGIWDWRLTDDTWYASDTYYTMLGYEPRPGEADRQVWLERVHPDDRAEAVRRISGVLQGDQAAYHYEARIRHADGNYHWCGVRGKVVSRDAEGRATRILGVRIDIHDFKCAQERIHALAHFDALTGLPNRTVLDERIGKMIDDARSTKTTAALLFLDLDRFKNVNDTLGHRVGDALLVAVAQRMQAVLGERDIVSRLGGDEFILGLPGADEAAAARVAQKLVAGISQPCMIEHYELVVTPSIGIAMYPADAVDFESLYRSADIAMYRTKHEGRCGFRFFTPEMEQRSARVLLLENALRRALEREEFSLHYQPQISLADGRVVGAEALLRWQHPELGAVSPAEFIRIAEDSGQIIAIGEWVMRTAVRQMKQWLDDGLPRMTIAVNLSALQFRHPDLLSSVIRLLDEAQFPADLFELELTEGVAMDDPQSAMALMDQLHAHRIRLSIDDFGTGYSSLSYLKRFKVYKLKIDQSFVRNISEDQEDRLIVGAIIQLASSMGLQTIAEGVETEAQLDFLRDQGCDQAQGYWFSRPLPPAQFAAHLQGRLALAASGQACS